MMGKLIVFMLKMFVKAVILMIWFDEGDYVYLNKLRKRRKYLKVGISEEQYSRLLICSRWEKIPMRYLVTRAVEIYLNQFGKYGWSEIPILKNVTPFDDD